MRQQREIVDSLVADRENARYTSEVVRYRSGLSSMPPPPAPPEPIDTAALVPEAPEPEDEPPSLVKEETFVDFLGALGRRMGFGDSAPETESEDQVEPEAPDAKVPTDSPEAIPGPASTPSPKPVISQAPTPPILAAGAARQEPTPATEAPVPPARTAVAARMAARPNVIDDLLDTGVAQAPMPPVQSAERARLSTPVASKADLAPLPTLRPAAAPAPPPVKPAQSVRRTIDRPGADQLAAALAASSGISTTRR
ncbi:MAG: hypothetical protein AAF637_01210 [Pseudomonadota bacterium]